MMRHDERGFTLDRETAIAIANHYRYFGGHTALGIGVTRSACPWCNAQRPGERCAWILRKLYGWCRCPLGSFARDVLAMLKAEAAKAALDEIAKGNVRRHEDGSIEVGPA